MSILDLLPRVEVNCLMFEGTHQRQLAILSRWGDKRLSNRGWLPSLAFTTLWRFTAFLWVVNSEFGGCFDKLCWGLLKNRSYQALEGNVLAHCYDPDIWWKGFGGWQIRFLLLNGICWDLHQLIVCTHLQTTKLSLLRTTTLKDSRNQIASNFLLPICTNMLHTCISL